MPRRVRTRLHASISTKLIGLTAVLDLLQQTAHLPDNLLVYCDSTYVINSITKWMPGWKRRGWRKGDGKPVLNVEIMKALDEAVRGRRVELTWVKGHSGHHLNEAADRLASAIRPDFGAHAYDRRRASVAAIHAGNHRGSCYDDNRPDQFHCIPEFLHPGQYRWHHNFRLEFSNSIHA